MSEHFEKLASKVKKGKRVFIAENATVIGDVKMGDESSAWYGSVIRGDSDIINIGHRSNIQDNAVVHVDPGFPVTIGNSVTVGHNAIVHGAYVNDFVIVGMGAIILNEARIGKYSIVGAGSLVTGGKEFPEYSLILGSPAKRVRSLTEEEVESIKKNAAVYVEKASKYM